MKKLFFIALFSFGLFTVNHAQTFLIYSATNDGGDTWDLGMTDAGTGGAYYEYTITPTQVRTGVIGSGFGFPFEFKCENSNGCGTYQFVPTTTTGINVPITSCGVPTELKYRLEVLIPFVVWEFELIFG